MTFPTAALGSIAKIVNGGTPDTKVGTYWDGGIAWLTPKDMGKSTGFRMRQTSRTISQVGLDNCSARLVPPRSVILSTRAPIGHLAINDVDMAFNQGCRGLVPSEILDATFLMYFLQANIGLLNDLGTGTTFKELSASALAQVRIPLPTLAEQQRIVAILDEAFDGIAEGAASARQAILTATELFSSVRDRLLRGGDDWKTSPLGKFFWVKHGFAFESQYFSLDGEHVLLTPGNFYERGGFRNRGEEQKRYSGPIPSGFTLEPGALLVAMTEQAAGLLGSPLIVPDGDVYLHNQRLGLIQPASDAPWDTRFFFHLFNSGPLRRYLHDSATGTKVRHTSPRKIEGFEARYPQTREEQAAVGARIDAIAQVTDALLAIQRRKLAALAELKQSLLARAFSGELTREPLAA